VWEIMTGAPLPEGADAVMMIEHVEVVDDSVRLIPPRTITSGDNAVAQGAEARAGDELLTAGVRLTFAQIALAAACGYASVEVFRRPRVAILATGDELVPIAATPGPGQIRNSNAPMLAALVTSAGGEPWVLPAAADNDAALDAALARAVDADLLLISGGVSAGKFDLVEPALARLGAQVHFDGVQMQPGKPVVFGEIPRTRAASPDPGDQDALPYFGLPGNPISSAVTFLLFAAPILAALAGSDSTVPPFAAAQFAVEAHGASKLTRSPLTRFLPAQCTFDATPEQLPRVQLVPWHGSGDLAALARSNCFLVVPAEKEAPKAEEIVRILLF
jgi:molybdopterin molybdotransferase